MVTKRFLNNLFWVAFVLLATTGNVFALQYKIANSFYVNSNQVRDTFTVDATGVYNIWVPTYTSSYPVNATSFPEILKSDFPYKYSFKIDLSDSQIAAPFFPKLRGKFWHAWTKLDTITLTASVPCTLTFLADATIDSSDLPAKVFITKTDYCPPDSLMGSVANKWIEAEDAEEHNFIAFPTSYSNVSANAGILKDLAKFGTGGGKVLRLNADSDSFPTSPAYFYAKYEFDIDSQGVYDIWCHGYAPNGKGWWASDPHSPFVWAIDDTVNGYRKWWPTDTTEGRPDIYSHQTYGWYMLTDSMWTPQPCTLSSGTHRLHIKIEQNVVGVSDVYEQMMDAFYIVKKDGSNSTDNEVPCDITASSNYLVRLAGVDETNVFYPAEDTVKIALDRRLGNSNLGDTFQIKYKVINYYDKVDSNTNADNLYFQSGNITSSISIPVSWYAQTGHYRVMAEIYHGQDTIAYLDTYFGVVYETRFPGPREKSIFGASQDVVLYNHLKKAGVKWVRGYKADWPFIEPNEPTGGTHNYNWNALDREIAKLKENDLNIVMCVQHSAPWASTAPVDSTNASVRAVYPPDKNDWAEFFETVVNRYKDDVKYWELWNEPYFGEPINYNWKGTPEEYRELTEVTHIAMKQAAPGDSSILGASEWCVNLCSEGYCDYHEAHTWHPYTTDAPEGQYFYGGGDGDWGKYLYYDLWNGWLQCMTSHAHSDNDEHQHHKEIWLTENITGAGGRGGRDIIRYSEPKKWGDWVVRTYTLSMADSVDHYFYFDFDDWCLGEAGGGSGLINPDATPRPGYIAHAVMAHYMEGTHFVEKKKINNDDHKIWAYIFEVDSTQQDTSRAIAVLWFTDGMIDSVSIDSLTNPSRFKVRDVMGNSVGTISGNTHYMSISSGSPVYLFADSVAHLQKALSNVSRIDSSKTPITHKITASTGDHGSLTEDLHGTVNPSGDSVIVGDEDMTCFIITADEGYWLDSLIVDDTLKVTEIPWGYLRPSYIFSPVLLNHTIRATFKPCPKVIASVNGGHGTVSPESTSVSQFLGCVNINIYPEEGYCIDSIIDNGVTVPNSNPYIVYYITSLHNVVVTFKPIVYTITAAVADTNSSYGSVSPGVQYVSYGNNASGIAYNPAAGYHISKVYDNGQEVTNLTNPYVITDVDTTHTLVYTFKPEYAVTATVADSNSSYGEVTPAVQYIPIHGSTSGIAYNPAAGYHISKVYDNGQEVTNLTNPYVITDVDTTHALVYTFKPEYTITAISTDTTHGVITSPEVQYVPLGETAVINYCRQTGYYINTIIDNSDTLTTNLTNPYTIPNVSENHTVYFDFQP